ncbi:hypothetical protein PV331_44170 [Streptomyces sp. WI04-05B]|nr:hypothetical protein [Streptomyces sp. WI04-05B]MDX2548779.1 hypothetical protein [Streptomyces sp. WI04-05B]
MKVSSHRLKRAKHRIRSWLTVDQRRVPASNCVPRDHFTASRSHG